LQRVINHMVKEKTGSASRRSFLKTMSITGLAVHSLVPGQEQLSAGESNPRSSQQPSFRRLDPEAELRVGMIGTSGHTELVLGAIPKIRGARLVAYALGDAERLSESLGETREAVPGSRDFETIKQHQSFLPETRVYKSYQEMFAKERLDVAGTCLPFTLNVFASMAAAEKGIHVMSEKPLATELEHLTQLERVLDRTGIQISAMLDMRLEPGIRTIRDAISRGLIGEPILATAQKSYKFGDSRPWFYKQRETYGGTIPWIGIHALDYIIYTTGLGITQAAAMQSNKSLSDYPGTEDNVGILLKLSNGGTAVVTLDYLRPAPAASHGDDRLRVIGSKGVVEMRGGKVELLTHDNPATELALLAEGSIFADFVAYLRGQSSPALLPGEAIAATRICLLARQAADERRIITI
jgi:predicted dehydrogenase